MIGLNALHPLLPGEEKLLSLATTGDRVTLGDGALPTDETVDADVRADLIRLLLIGSDPKARLHDKGIRLRGARILGKLDLQGCDCTNDLTLTRCHLERTPSFINARMRGLHLIGCHVPGLMADNAHFDGSVFLRSGFKSFDEISLPGARIIGDLQICDAEITGKGKPAIFGASLRVEGSIYLGDYPYDESDTPLHAEGALIFTSAKIGQDFFARNCAIAPEDGQIGQILLFDADEGGELTALSLVRAEIGGVLYSKSNQISGGIVNLSGARARRLNDEALGPGAAYRMRLDGFEYQDFAQQADTSLTGRLEWLARRPAGVEFSAQPYEHLARVLNRIGHRTDAHQVLMRKERLQRAANMDVIAQKPFGSVRVALAWLNDKLLRYLIGYGYRPVLAVIWGCFMIAALAFFFQKTWDAGDFAPNAAPILVSKGWVAATESHPENPAAFWASRGQAGQDYETFQSVAYAADLVIPIVTLGQEAAWAPSTSRSPLGRVAWWIRWFAKGVGWVITALGAAAITGVIRRD